MDKATYVLRESMRVTWEAPFVFVYLLWGLTARCCSTPERLPTVVRFPWQKRFDRCWMAGSDRATW